MNNSKRQRTEEAEEEEEEARDEWGPLAPRHVCMERASRVRRRRIDLSQTGSQVVGIVQLFSAPHFS